LGYRLIVWDFDGTLADTLTLALSTYNAIAPRFGCLPVEDPALARQMPTRDFMRKHRISLLRLPRMVKAYHAATRDRMNAVRVFDGLPDVLRSVKSSGCRLGVVSSNAADNIRACLHANGLEEVFDFIIGHPRLFGKARVLRRLLKEQAVEPRDFLYVGDEMRDMEAARKAGVDVAAVGWGIHSVKLLADQQPTYVWHTIGDVLPSLVSRAAS
jgi:phosphoglycolate phosphatase